MPELRYVSESALQGEHGARLLRYLLARGADEFTITVMALLDTPAPFVDAFEDELAPFVRDMAPRRTLTDSISAAYIRPVRLWSLNEESLDRLLSFRHEGLFHWPAGPDGWFEDLIVYRRGELVLGLDSHEREGMLRLTPQEHGEVAALGIPSRGTAEGTCF